MSHSWSLWASSIYPSTGGIWAKIACYHPIWCSVGSSSLQIRKDLRTHFSTVAHSGCRVKPCWFRNFPVCSPRIFLPAWEGGSHPCGQTRRLAVIMSSTLQVLLLLSASVSVCVGREKREFTARSFSHLCFFKG